MSNNTLFNILFNDVAKDMVIIYGYFVKIYSILHYGEDTTNYNVHRLIHDVTNGKFYKTTLSPW